MSYIVTCNLQPIGRFQGQATDVDIARKEIRNVKIEMVFFFLSLVERERINNLIMNLKWSHINLSFLFLAFHIITPVH